MQNAKVDEWWKAYAFPIGWKEALVKLISYQTEAACIDTYDQLVFNGLIQTEKYIKALWEQLPASYVAQASCADFTGFRTVLQKQVFEGRNLRLARFLVPEATLYSYMGSKAVMHEQLQHLLNLLNEPRIELRVLPYELTKTWLMFASNLGAIMHYGETYANTIAMDHRDSITFSDNKFEFDNYSAEFVRLWKQTTLTQTRHLLEKAAGHYAS